eukprot:3937225-Karenia_brevis.AAC.1
MSRLDRMYSNLPSWRLLLCQIHTSTDGHITDPNRLSDHATVLSSVHNKKENGARRIPVWITKDPLFPIAMESEMKNVDLSAYDARQALQRIETCMRTAGYR